VFVGHLGLAYFAKSVRAEVPLLALVTAAYAPDVVRLLLTDAPGREVLSHSIGAVLVLAAMSAAAWLLTARGPRGGALALAAVCLLHWPADVYTGCKPLLDGRSWLGFIAYRDPVLDLFVELPILWGGWLLCRRLGLRRGLHGLWMPLVATALQIAFLVSLYAGSEFFIGAREWTWHPREGLFTLKRVADPETLFCRAPVEPGT
jgi:hypothetical protein